MWVPLYGPPLPRRFSGPQLPATKAVYRDLISAPARGNTYRGELLLGFRVTHPFFSEESTPHRTPCDMLPREVFEASVRMCLSLSMCVCHPSSVKRCFVHLLCDRRSTTRWHVWWPWVPTCRSYGARYVGTVCPSRQSSKLTQRVGRCLAVPPRPFPLPVGPVVGWFDLHRHAATAQCPR